MTDEEPGHKA